MRAHLEAAGAAVLLSAAGLTGAGGMPVVGPPQLCRSIDCGDDYWKHVVLDQWTRPQAVVTALLVLAGLAMMLQSARHSTRSAGTRRVRMLTGVVFVGGCVTMARPTWLGHIESGWQVIAWLAAVCALTLWLWFALPPALQGHLRLSSDRLGGDTGASRAP